MFLPLYDKTEFPLQQISKQKIRVIHYFGFSFQSENQTFIAILQSRNKINKYLLRHVTVKNAPNLEDLTI